MTTVESNKGLSLCINQMKDINRKNPRAASYLYIYTMGVGTNIRYVRRRTIFFMNSGNLHWFPIPSQLAVALARQRRRPRPAAGFQLVFESLLTMIPRSSAT